MKLLLDTHVFLWWIDDQKRIGSQARRAIGRSEIVYVSVASALEIAIKISRKKLAIPGTVEEAVDASRFSRLPISFSHAEAVAALPFHHRDPFHRILIAQAQYEGLTLVTADRDFEPYRLPILWA